MRMALRRSHVLVVLLVGLACTLGVNARGGQSWPSFLLGEGNSELSLRSPYKVEGEEISHWRTLGQAKVLDDVNRQLILVNYALPSQSGVMYSARAMANKNFDIYFDWEVRQHPSQSQAGEGVAFWLLNFPPTKLGNILGMSDNAQGTAIVMQPPTEARPVSSIFTISPNGRNNNDFTNLSTKTFGELGSSCQIKQYDGMTRIFIEFKDGKMKVWSKRIPSSSIDFCFETTLPSRNYYLAVSSATSESAISEHYLHSVQVRVAEQEERYVPKTQPTYRRSTGMQNSEIDNKFFDLQATLMNSMSKPNPNEQFLKETKQVMDAIFAYLRRKDNLMKMINVAKEAKGKIKETVDEISKNTDQIGNGIEEAHASTKDFHGAWVDLSQSLADQVKQISEEAVKHKSNGIFIVFVVSSQIAFLALFYYTRSPASRPY